jgi:hypothetical protein
MIIGFIWYNPKTVGNAWMKAAGLDEEKLKGANMLVIFGLSYFFSLLIATVVQFMVIHQLSVFSILANQSGIQDPTSEIGKFYADFMLKYGNEFRTFKHGAFHGTICGIFFATPVLGINALFERRSAKYILIHSGYWIITLALMGGVICQFA